MNKKIAAVAAGILTLGVASGTAFTDSVSIDDKTAGYGTADVTGAKVSAVNFEYNTGGSILTGVTLKFQAPVDGKVVTLSLKTAEGTTPVGVPTVAPIDANDSNTVTFSDLSQSVEDLKGIAVSVVDNDQQTQ